MNPLGQPDLHPDADLLNAFAEHALPEAERAPIVAHMAACARCREVVFLAQRAAGPEIAPLSKPDARPGWLAPVFAGWRVALIPAAALAAVACIVLWVQIHSRPSVETAQLAPHAAPAPVEPVSPATLQAAPSGQDRNKAASAPPQKQPRAVIAGVAPRDHLAPRTAAAAPAIAPPDSGDIHLDGRSASMARYSPPSQTAAGFEGPQQPIANAAPAPAPPNIFTVQGAALPTPPNGAPQSASQAELAPQPMNGLAVLRLARHAKLPSGLNTVSSAALLNRLLAVDSAGAVYLSQDGGKRWESVHAQWSGKAVEVQAPPQAVYGLALTAAQRRALNTAQAPEIGSTEENPDGSAPPPPPQPLPAANSAMAVKRKAAPAAAAPPLPATLFRLVTDRHQAWVSADGKVWTRQ